MLEATFGVHVNINVTLLMLISNILVCRSIPSAAVEVFYEPSASCCMCRFQESYDDPHKPLPSPVVHVRGLVDGIMEADLVEALQEFGAIR